MAGFWSRIFGRSGRGAGAIEEKASPMADVEMDAGLEQLIFGAREDSNLAALVRRYGLLQSLIEKIAVSTATLPWQVVDDAGEVRDDLPLSAIMRRPNPDMDWRHFVHVISQHWIIYGDVFLHIVRRVNKPGGAPLEVWPLDPYLMKINLNNDGSVREYVYGGDGGRKRTFRAGDPRLHHIRAPSVTDSYRGQSIIAQAIAISDILNMYSQKLYESLQGGINSPAVLVFQSRDKDGFLSPDSRQRIKEAVREFATGRTRSGTIMTVFDVSVDKLDLQRKAIEADDMDARNEYKRELCFLLGVPPVLMGLKNDSTYNNYRTALAAFYTDTVLPRVAMPLASGLTAALATQGDQLRINVDAIPALAEQRAESMDTVSKATFLTINEKRAMMGLPPVDGGDVVLVSGSMVPLDEAVAMQDMPPEKAADVYRLPVLAGGKSEG